MSSQFHNRLVGTVVLVALGVILLPDILDGKKDLQEEQFAEIPLRPNVIEQQTNADEMFEVLSAQDVGELNGAQLELVESQPNDEAALAQAVKSTPPKDESVKPDSVKEVSKLQTAKIENKSEPKTAPTKSTATITEPGTKSEVKPTTVAKTQQPNTAVAKPSKDEVKVVSRESLKAGFTLQLGAFSNAANVKALVAQLRKNGFKAYTIPDNPKEGVLTKVFIGPDVSEAKLKKMKEDIERLTQLKGQIVPFNPLES